MASCLICGKEAEHVANRAGGGLVKCRVCGDYRYTSSAMPKLSHQTNDPEVAAKVAVFIKEQNLQNNVPTFYTHPADYPREVTLEEAVDTYPGSICERTARTLVNLYLLQGDFDGFAELRHGKDHPYCFAKNSQSMVRLIRGLEDEGLIEDVGSHQQAMRISLTMAGWSEVEEKAAVSQEEHAVAETDSAATLPQRGALSYEYDVVLSFAGEQRSYVEDVADILRRQGLGVFYDYYEDVELWGKDLVEHLHEVYTRKGKYCMMFISREYAEKVWPTAERRAALERQVAQKGEYILPARFDDTELPGLPSTVGYIDLSDLSPLDFAEKVVRKVTGRNLLAELEAPVTLKEPFAPPYQGAPKDRISIQHAVGEIAHQAGLEHSITETRERLGDAARKWIKPALVDIPAGEALRRILDPYGIRWSVSGGKLKTDLAADRQWTEVGRWEGKGLKTTEAFTVVREWRVRWEKKAARGWNFKICLYRPRDEDGLETLVDENTREASGETYVHRPGRYYLKVQPRLPQEHWEVVVEQQAEA